MARWSGNALLVDTISLNDQTWLDAVGMPHSDQLKIAERYELGDPDHLRVTVTVTDPATFTAPWDMQVTFKRQPGPAAAGERLRREALASPERQRRLRR